MKKYSFRLQTLLRVREIHEEEAERFFRLALRALTVAVEELDSLAAEARRINEDLAERRRERLDVEIQQLYDRYIMRLRERIKDQIAAVRLAEQEVESRRLELMERVKDRKTIEELRLRDFDQYLLELRRFEQSVIDDLATLRGAAGLESSLEGTA